MMFIVIRLSVLKYYRAAYLYACMHVHKGQCVHTCVTYPLSMHTHWSIGSFVIRLATSTPWLRLGQKPGRYYSRHTFFARFTSIAHRSVVAVDAWWSWFTGWT